ncbi:hypothetical protein H257_02386 [Aphanomyces astaci]|uniref:Uncharacterized protein n=1 Tax=Aphanomyces astaci TaxID=112090 RepID=W4H3I2_APHAT|nr:hypothetical protein H257_02386 [Aphanomyces astaci]ETV85824.1 hypothetical protein H257_02386 [Aphanomyces astaci]|eukprot:XP_009824296.1 hypothetical protein H257_02386 [Aphanomyces astaci]
MQPNAWAFIDDILGCLQRHLTLARLTSGFRGVLAAYWRLKAGLCQLASDFAPVDYVRRLGSTTVLQRWHQIQLCAGAMSPSFSAVFAPKFLNPVDRARRCVHAAVSLPLASLAHVECLQRANWHQVDAICGTVGWPRYARRRCHSSPWSNTVAPSRLTATCPSCSMCRISPSRHLSTIVCASERRFKVSLVLTSIPACSTRPYKRTLRYTLVVAGRRALSLDRDFVYLSS